MGLCSVQNELQILGKASELFLKYGIRSVSMDDIARELGISKKTIYVHYQDKDALLVAFMKRQLELHEQIFERMKQGSENVIAEILMISGNSVQEMQKYHTTLLYDLQKYHRNVWQLFEDFKNETIHRQIKDQIERGIATDFFRSEIDVEVAAIMHLQQITTALNPDVFSPRLYDTNLVFRQITMIFLRGICTKKGLKMIDKIHLNSKPNR